MTQTTSRPVSGSIASLVEAYDRDGLAFKERVLTPEQVSRAAAGVQWAMTHLEGNYKWIKQRSYEWLEQHPIFVEIIEHPLVLDFARATLGDDFQLIAAQCSRNTKAEKYLEGLTLVHQDGGLMPTPEQRRPDVPDHRYAFSAMWYLQDTPLEMGPTELLIGSHLHGTEKRTNADIEGGTLPVFRRAIPAGSLLIFSHYTWHRGAENATDRPRDLITNAYAQPQLPRSHLSVKDASGAEVYAPPEPLVRSMSPTMQRLLRK